MHTFFRRIRKGLLEGGHADDPPRRLSASTSKYLLYAIGEILLVVVGILIALQINNWNEWRKDRASEREILIRMKTDLQKDTIYLQQRIQLAQSEWHSYYEYIHKSYQRQQTVEEYLALQAHLSLNAENLILQDKTFSEISSAGRIDLLTDDEVKDAIIDYYRYYSIAGAHIAEMNQTSISMISVAEDHAPTLKYEKDILSELFDAEYMFQKEEWQFINDPSSRAFKSRENAVAYYAMKQRIFEDYYQRILQNAKQLLFRIDTSLNPSRQISAY